MKKIRVLALLLILIQLVACTDKTQEVAENTPILENGKYVCEEVKYPMGEEEKITGLKLMNYNGVLRYIKGKATGAYIEYFAYDLNENGNWDETPLEWGRSNQWKRGDESNQWIGNTSLYNFLYTPWGDLYALKYTVISQEKIKNELCKLEENGNAEIIPLKVNSDDQVISWFNINEDGTCVLSFETDIATIKQYDMTTGEEINRIQNTTNDNSKFTIENEFFGSSFSVPGAIQVFDSKDGNYRREILLNGFNTSSEEKSQNYTVRDEERNLYCYNAQGIFGGNYLNKELEQIVSSDIIDKRAKTNDDSIQINSFVKGNEEQEDFYVQFAVKKIISESDGDGGITTTSNEPEQYLVHYYKE